METHITSVLLGFGEALGLGGLALDEDGHCCLKFDTLVVHLQATEVNADVLLYSPLATLPDAKNPSPVVMQRLLAANYGMLGTHGSTIGIHPETGEVLLARRFSSKGLEVLGFEAVLESFIHTAEQTQQFLQSQQTSGEAFQEASIQMPMHGMIRA